MLRTDGDGHKADTAPHKTERPEEKGEVVVSPEGREDQAKAEPPPKPVKSPGSGFGSFES